MDRFRHFHVLHLVERDHESQIANRVITSASKVYSINKALMLIYSWINEVGFLACDVNWFVVPVFVVNWLFVMIHTFGTVYRDFLPKYRWDGAKSWSQGTSQQRWINRFPIFSKLFLPYSLFLRVFTSNSRNKNKQRIQSFLRGYIEWLLKSEQELALN